LDHCEYLFFEPSSSSERTQTRYFFGVLTSMLADRLR
jgi:hypothetical protein